MCLSNVKGFFTVFHFVNFVALHRDLPSNFLFLSSMSLYFYLAFVNICQMNKEIKSFDDKE